MVREVKMLGEDQAPGMKRKVGGRRGVGVNILGVYVECRELVV